MEENNLRMARLEKLEKLKELGIDPYPAASNKKQTVAQCLDMEGKSVSTAGRLFSFREHGNIAFADLKDETGKIQLFFQKKLLGDAFKQLKLLDIGDFMQVEGEVVKTTVGEISIAPTSYTLLTKSLRPIPSEFYGFKDEETRLRKRYIDLLMHPELRDLFKKKTMFWQSMRTYLLKKGFMEVETPVLQPIPGGADARPFVTHQHAQDIDLYLRISLELPLKRLLVGGFEKVFEIGRIFRNEGISDEHLQDYTQMEFYWAYADYNDLMDLLQEMYQTIIKETFGTLTTTWKGQEINWSGDWPRVEYTQLLNDHWGVKTEDMSVSELYALGKKLGVSLEPNLGKGRLLDYIYKKTIRPTLIQPMFVMNHPVEVEPLAKRLPENPNKVQRTQILAMGSELGKGFSELNDPIDQYDRFKEQQSLRDAGDEEAQMMDEDYVEALEYGMPPAAGFGVSERLFAMLVDKPVREMVFFPTMKPEQRVSTVASSTTLERANVTTSGKSNMTREEAYALLLEHMSNKNLIKHSLAAEATMRALAKHFGEDEEVWGITGLLHDVDYELAQKEDALDKHGILLFEKDPEFIPEPMAHAIKSHNYTHTNVMPESKLDWAITCCDQLTGITVAAALIHPDKKLASIDPEFVLKRFNMKSFAKGASRETIAMCEEKLGIPLPEFIAITLKAMQGIHEELGL